MSQAYTQWETKLLWGNQEPETLILSGPSLPVLRETVKAWVREQRPVRISIVDTVPILRRQYAYGESGQTYTALFPRTHFERGRASNRVQCEQDGYYCVYQTFYGAGQSQVPIMQISLIGDIDALARDIAQHLIVRQGSDYQDILTVDGKVQLDRVRTIRKTNEVDLANDLLRRGWRLIAIEMEGTTDEVGRLARSTTLFVLGHPEIGAL